MKIYLLNRGDVQVFGNGERLVVYREAGKEYVEGTESEDGSVMLRFLRKSEFARRGWFLYALLFWVVGILGLFTPRYCKFSDSLDCTVRIMPGEAVPMLRFAHYTGERRDGEPVPAVTAIGECAAEIDGGYYVCDKAAGRRRTVYKICSWLLRLAVVVGAVVTAIVLMN